MRIILGSSSPRRTEIFNYFTLPFVQIPSHFDEELVVFEGDPKAYATSLSENKAAVLSLQFKEEVIVTADTIVYFNKKVYNKPKDREEAFKFLSELSGNWHHVYTSVTVRQGTKVFSAIAEAKILFNKLSSEQINLYLDRCNYLDKAGGYAIQQAGSLIVSKIEGCYYNVMGLPVNTLSELLLKVGINLWNYLKKF